MINLLPTDYADSIRYGRQNTMLRGWLICALGAILGLLIILVGGWFYIDQQARTLQKNIDITNEQLKIQNLAKVQTDAKEITSDIKLINKVLSSEIRFSALIQTIGNDMPSGAVLSGISLSKVSGGFDLAINAKDKTAAARVALNLSDPKNILFSKVDIVTISCNPSLSISTADNQYPCTATLRALFSNEAKTKFINVPAAAQP